MQLPGQRVPDAYRVRSGGMTVAALFVRSDSVYKSMPGVDAWCAQRDARRWPGGHAVVAHPPCGQWAGLRKLAKFNPEEKALGPLAVDQVRREGGVLEHPAGSTLWAHCGMPRPGAPADRWGGWTLQVEQHWWGHRARKRTWLYIVGCPPGAVPPYIPQLDLTMHVISTSRGRRKDHPLYRPDLPKHEREATPPAFAAWLVELATRCTSPAEAVA